jgi:hypothetical protein
MFLVKSQVLAVLKTAAGEERRQVRRHVRVGVAEIGAVEKPRLRTTDYGTTDRGRGILTTDYADFRGWGTYECGARSAECGIGKRQIPFPVVLECLSQPGAL